VNAGANREVELTDRADDCAGARDRPRGAIEDRKEAVARRVELLAAKARQLAPDEDDRLATHRDRAARAG